MAAAAGAYYGTGTAITLFELSIVSPELRCRNRSGAMKIRGPGLSRILAALLAPRQEGTESRRAGAGRRRLLALRNPDEVRRPAG